MTSPESAEINQGESRMTDEHHWVKTRDEDGYRCWYCEQCEHFNYSEFPTREGCMEPRVTRRRRVARNVRSETEERS